MQCTDVIDCLSLSFAGLGKGLTSLVVVGLIIVLPVAFIVYRLARGKKSGTIRLAGITLITWVYVYQVGLPALPIW